MVVIGLSWFYCVCTLAARPGGREGSFCLFASSWHRCLACESFFRPVQGQRGWALGRARQGTVDDRMGCAQPFCVLDPFVRARAGAVHGAG